MIIVLVAIDFACRKYRLYRYGNACPFTAVRSRSDDEASAATGTSASSLGLPVLSSTGDFSYSRSVKKPSGEFTLDMMYGQTSPRLTSPPSSASEQSFLSRKSSSNRQSSRLKLRCCATKSSLWPETHSLMSRPYGVPDCDPGLNDMKFLHKPYYRIKRRNITLLRRQRERRQLRDDVIASETVCRSIRHQHNYLRQAGCFGSVQNLQSVPTKPGRRLIEQCRTAGSDNSFNLATSSRKAENIIHQNGANNNAIETQPVGDAVAATKAGQMPPIERQDPIEEIHHYMINDHDELSLIDVDGDTSSLTTVTMATRTLILMMLLAALLAYAHQIILGLFYDEQKVTEDCLLFGHDVIESIQKTIEYYSPFNSDEYLSRRNHHMFNHAFGGGEY